MERQSYLSRRAAMAAVLAFAGAFGMPTQNQAAIERLHRYSANPFGFDSPPPRRGATPNRYKPHQGAQECERRLRQRTSGRGGSDCSGRGDQHRCRHSSLIRVVGASVLHRRGKRRSAQHYTGMGFVRVWRL